MNQFFASGGQSIGASASVLPVNTQDWFPLGLTGLISLQSKGLTRAFSNTTVQKQRSIYGCIRTERARKQEVCGQGAVLKIRKWGSPEWGGPDCSSEPQWLRTCGGTGPAGAEEAVLTISTGCDITQDNRRDTWYGQTMNQGLKLLGKEGDCQNWKIWSDKLDGMRLWGRGDFSTFRVEKWLEASLWRCKQVLLTLQCRRVSRCLECGFTITWVLKRLWLLRAVGNWPAVKFKPCLLALSAGSVFLAAEM